VVFCSPIYFYALPSLCKTWIDRSQRFWEARRKGDAWLLEHPERQGFACLVGGQPAGQKLFDGARLTLKYFLVNFGMTLAEPVGLRGKTAGRLEADGGPALALGRPGPGPGVLR
jgi:multimeric flavodoxin WrbA